VCITSLLICARSDKMLEMMDMLLAKKRAGDRKVWLEASGDMAAID